MDKQEHSENGQSELITELVKLNIKLIDENLSNEEKLAHAKSLRVTINSKIIENTEPISEDDIKYRDNFSNWMELQIKQLDDSMFYEYYSGGYTTKGYNAKEQWIGDSINMVRVDKRVPEFSTYDGIYYMGKLFGPVGLMWNKHINRAATMEATVVRYDSKKELKAFLKENRPLVYCLMKQQTYNVPSHHYGYKTIVFDKTALTTRYICRHFPEVGKLPWWKYQLQFFVNKLPMNKKLRAYFYRLLATN